VAAPRSIVLIGLPGCGKSSAGRLTAALLGAPFHDLDEMIARTSGRPITQVFAEEGEAGFRARERDAMGQVLGGPPGVIAPGGGWAAEPGNLELVEERAVLIYLRVTPATAAERIGDEAGRPLLAGHKAVTRLTELLESRERYYRRAAHSIDTDGRPVEHVARSIVRLARAHGAWLEGETVS
jgi:shikimate kinase